MGKLTGGRFCVIFQLSMSNSITIGDTHAAVKNLEAKGASKELAEEIVATVQSAKLGNDPATKADITDLRIEMRGLETRLYRAMLIQTGAIAAIVLGMLQFAL